MKVNGITSPIPNFPQTRTKSQAEHQLEPVQAQQDAGDMPESTPTELEESQDSGVKGVIRNLLDGHYKGVADVRLRIVHYEELKAIESQQLKTAVGPEVGDLLASIQDAVSNIPELNQPLGTDILPEGEGQTESGGSTPTVSGLYAGFTDTVNGLVEGFKSGQITSTNDLIDGIKNAFANFVDSLQTLLVPQAEEIPPAEGTDVVESPIAEGTVETALSEDILQTQTEQPILPELENTINDVPAADETQPSAIEPLPPEDSVLPTEPDYPSLINGLEDVFSAQITELTGALTAVRVLPELSEPSGSGTAYKKFLGIYNELWSIQPPDSAAVDILKV